MSISPEFMTGLLSFLFTVMIFSYIVADNPAFRLATHAFIGVAAGYVVVLVFRQVVVDKMVVPLVIGSPLERGLALIALMLSLLLFVGKLFPQMDWLGRPIVAFLVGVGTASAVAGAVLGTLFPQMLASINMFGLNMADGALSTAQTLGSAFFVLLGTIVTLASFQFTTRKRAASAKPNSIGNLLAQAGQAFIALTLGAIFAGVLAAALTAFVDRVQSIVIFFDTLIF